VGAVANPLAPAGAACPGVSAGCRAGRGERAVSACRSEPRDRAWALRERGRCRLGAPGFPAGEPTPKRSQGPEQLLTHSQPRCRAPRQARRGRRRPDPLNPTPEDRGYEAVSGAPVSPDQAAGSRRGRHGAPASWHPGVRLAAAEAVRPPLRWTTKRRPRESAAESSARPAARQVGPLPPTGGRTESCAARPRKRTVPGQAAERPRTRRLLRPGLAGALPTGERARQGAQSRVRVQRTPVQ